MKHSRFNLRAIMLKAWQTFRKHSPEGVTFGECLHRAWQSAKAEPRNAAVIAAAKAATGVTEECNTWAGWKKAGREVIHGAKSLFGCNLEQFSAGDAAKPYKARFFGLSQTQPAAVVQ